MNKNLLLYLAIFAAAFALLLTMSITADIEPAPDAAGQEAPTAAVSPAAPYYITRDGGLTAHIRNFSYAEAKK